MAQRVITQLVDDLDGTELVDGAGETVTFGVDGTTYEIDLSAENAEALRDALQPYIASGRRVGRGRGRGRGASKRQAGTSNDTKAIRDWARESGKQVPDRGRLPASIVEEYEAAH